MAAMQRTTVYLDPELYRALKIKAATLSRGLSDLVNEAVSLALREDAVDEEAFRKRAQEQGRAFSQVLRDLKRARLL